MSQQPTFQFKPSGGTSASASSSAAAASSSQQQSGNTSAVDSPASRGDNNTSPTSSDYLLPPVSPRDGTASGSDGGFVCVSPALSQAESDRFTPLTLPSPLQRAMSRGSLSSGTSTPIMIGGGLGGSNASATTGGMTASGRNPASAATSSTANPPAASSSLNTTPILGPSDPTNFRTGPNINTAIKPTPTISTSVTSSSAASANTPTIQSLSTRSATPTNFGKPTIAQLPTSYVAFPRNTGDRFTGDAASSASSSSATTSQPSLPADRVPLLSSSRDRDDDHQNTSFHQQASSRNTYYEQYEATVLKIRSKRLKEAEEKAAKAGTRDPNQTSKEVKIVGFLLLVLLFLISIIIFVLYPRIPIFTVSGVNVRSLRIWSDGSVNFAIETHMNVENDNFLSTGIDSVVITVTHNNASLGTPTELDALKWSARSNNDLIFPHIFSTKANPMDPGVFFSLFQEMIPNGQLTFNYRLLLVTSENFRLRNIEVLCVTTLQISAYDVPPTTQVLSNLCTHTEQTG